MKKSIILILIAAIFIQSKAQNQGQERIDSLLIILDKTIEDPHKVNMLNFLSEDYKSINPDEGIKFGKQALVLAERLNFKKGMAIANTNIGQNYSTGKSDYPTALEYLFNALQLNEELGDKNGIAKNFLVIGGINRRLSDHPKALEYLFKGLQMYEELGDKVGMAICLNSIGSTYQQKRDFSMALKFTFKALKINQELGDKSEIARSIGNIGMAHMEKKDYSKALEYQFKALKIYYEEIGNSRPAYVLSEVGNVYLNIVKESDKVLLNELFAGEKKSALKQSKLYTDSALVIFKDLGLLDGIFYCYNNLSEIQALLGDFKGSLESYKYYTLYRDSVFNNEKSKSIVQMQMNYDRGKEDAIANLEQKRQKQQKIILLIGLILAIGFGFWDYRHKKRISNEKKRSDDLLLNILPEEIANELKATGFSEAKQYNDVTVLFTDFVNFTGIGEQLSPSELVAELHKNFTAFDTIIEKYDLEKIKTIGDAYMAVCGMPHESKDHAHRVINAALEIRNFVAQSNGKFQIRIGINSGAVVAGIVGVKKFAYDIWGDTVNTAARMEEQSEAGKINISGATYELVKTKFKCTHRGKITAKNKGEIDMYFIEN